MATFKYTAKDSAGDLKKGTVEAGSKERAAMLMQERGLVPISIVAKRRFLDVKNLVRGLRGVSQKEKVVFTRQLATMVGAGLPLTQALSILRDQSRESPFGDILEYVLGEVEGGKPLSETLAKFPENFSRTYVSLVQAAEASGALKDILLRLASKLEDQDRLRSDIKGAMLYPAIILLAMLAVMLLLLIFVIPKLKSIYESFEAELPLATQLFLGLSDLLIRRWWLVIVLVVLAVYAVRWFKSTERGEYMWDEASLRLPVFGPLFRQLELIEITRTLSLLLTSGVPILDALRIVQGASENVLYRDVLGKAVDIVKRGESLAQPFTTSDYFPPIVARMIQVGEESGELGPILLKISDYFEEEAEHTVENLTTALEPMVMVLLGVGVGFMVLSIIMPVYNLTGQF